MNLVPLNSTFQEKVELKHKGRRFFLYICSDMMFNYSNMTPNITSIYIYIYIYIYTV
jgi:hypothetical protein